jgi:diaminohydroxyphosphoribosylaminopyrimidine deaminase/5-amino-6-(5-phosphoribosylamino)uracil reductase
MPANPIANDGRWMARAMELALGGRGAVEPNPLVGCVIVRDDQIIGEAFHQTFGGPHAEPNALAACSQSPAGATMYVTLEPCSHTHKKTPPCVPRIIEAKIGRVVIGTPDPNPLVAGRGIEQLRAAGMQVDLLDLPSSRQLIAPFVATTLHHRPYVTLKWAETSDGKVAGAPGSRLLISNACSWRAVHQLRSRCDAILVGVNTVLADDPILTVRGLAPMRALRRVVLSRDLPIPLSARIAQPPDSTPVEFICSSEARQEKTELVHTFESRGITVTSLPVDSFGQPALLQVLSHLGAQGITHLLVEPGPTLARSFIEQNLVDRVWRFRSPRPAGDPGARNALAIDYPESGRVDLEGDTLTEYLNPASGVFYSLDPSPDFKLIR